MADPVTPVFGVPTMPQSHNYEEHNSKHTGGAGIARDILGTLGDFLLTRLHMPAMYAPAQKERKLKEAFDGFNNDPLAAIDRVTDVDFTAGNKLRDTYIDNQRLAAAQASTQEAREGRLELARQAAADRSRNNAAAFMNSLGNLSPDKRAAAYPDHRSKILNSTQARADPKYREELAGLYPEQYDEDAVTSAISGSVPVATQWQQKLTKEGQEAKAASTEASLKERADYHSKMAGIGKENADAHMISANKPRAGPRASEGDIVQGLIDSGKPMTNGQRARVTKYTNGTRADGPPVGYKNSYGTFKGGDYKDPKNWEKNK